MHTYSGYSGSSRTGMSSVECRALTRSLRSTRVRSVSWSPFPRFNAGPPKGQSIRTKRHSNIPELRNETDIALIGNLGCREDSRFINKMKGLALEDSFIPRELGSWEIARWYSRTYASTQVIKHPDVLYSKQYSSSCRDGTYCSAISYIVT